MKKILVSRGLPRVARDLIPADIDVDANGFERALPKQELIARLRGRQGLICQIVDTIDDDVLGSEGLRVVANLAVGHHNIDLLPLRNVVLAPHIASASFDTRVAMASLAVRNCLAVLEGTPPITPVS